MSAVLFGPDGSVRFIYSDAVADVARGFAQLKIARASHVEPTADGRWAADLAPVGGPTLGPFASRAEALSEEVAWLERHDVPLPA